MALNYMAFLVWAPQDPSCSANQVILTLWSLHFVVIEASISYLVAKKRKLFPAPSLYPQGFLCKLTTELFVMLFYFVVFVFMKSLYSVLP